MTSSIGSWHQVNNHDAKRIPLTSGSGQDTDENDLKRMCRKLDAKCAVLVYIGKTDADSGILLRWRSPEGRRIARLLYQKFDEWMNTLAKA